MIYEKNRLFFRSLRVLYQGEDLKKLISQNKYDFITIISYSALDDQFALTEKGFALKHKELANIYLSGTIEDILQKFARATRQEITRTYEIKELDFRIADTNKAGTYSLYKEFERAQGRKPWKKDTFSSVLNFNAYYKGKLIAAVPCYDLFPYLQVRAMFSKRMGAREENKEFYKLIGSATRRLIFEICKYGKERNYQFVGLGSVNYSTPQKANVANFKMFFGSEEGTEYTYIYKSRRFVLLTKIRNFFKNLLSYSVDS